MENFQKLYIRTAHKPSGGRSGVYIIRCVANKLVYVGQTTRFAARRRQHENDLRTGRHKNARLQNAYNKYGADTFTITLAINGSENLTAREQMVVNLYHKRGANVANFGICVDSPARGASRPDARARRLSEGSTNIQKLQDGFAKWKATPEYAEWRARANAIGTHHLHLARANAATETKRLTTLRDAVRTPEHREKQRQNTMRMHAAGVFADAYAKNQKAIVDVNTCETWESVNACASALGVKACTVSSHIAGRTATCRGRILRFAASQSTTC